MRSWNAILFIILSISFGNGGELAAQTSFTKSLQDSLWGVWSNPKAADTVRLNALGRIGTEGYLRSFSDSAVYISKLQYAFAQSKGLKSYMAKALHMEAISLRDAHKYDEAEQKLNQALAINTEIKNFEGAANNHYRLGTVLRIKGDLPAAIKQLTLASSHYEKVGDGVGEAKVATILGQLYLDMENHAQAMIYFNRALQIFIKLGRREGWARIKVNMAMACQTADKYQEAVVHLNEALPVFDSIGNPRLLATVYVNLSCAYRDLKEYKTALRYCDMALEIAETGHFSELAYGVYMVKGVVLRLQGNDALAIPLFEKAMVLVKEMGSTLEMETVANELYKSYRATGQYDKALEMYEMAMVYRDSLMNEESQKEVMRQQFQYDFDKKDALAKAEQDKKDALATEQLRRRSQQRNALIGGLILVIGLAGVSYRSFVRKRRDNAIITHQKELVEAQKAEVDVRNGEIMASINYARRLQEAVLPKTSALAEAFPDSFLLYMPRDVVSGDFYWVTPLPLKGGGMSPSFGGVGEAALHPPLGGRGVSYLAVGDCTGHGVPGAMLSVIGLNSLNRCINDLSLTRPKDVLMQMTIDILMAFEGAETTVRDGMDMALCAIDLDNLTLTYAGANSPLWIARGTEMLQFAANRRPVGFHDSEAGFTQEQVKLEKGDVIYLFSDGFADQHGGPDGKKLMRKRFREMLLEISTLPMSNQRERLLAEYLAWRGTVDQTDDVCVVGVRV